MTTRPRSSVLAGLVTLGLTAVFVLTSVYAEPANACKGDPSGCPSDTNPPSDVILHPSKGAIVSGTVTIRGSASDDVKVAKVEIRVDGSRYKRALGTTSWSYALDTSALVDGSHVVTSRATDSSRNTATAAVSISVINAVSPQPSPSPYPSPSPSPSPSPAPSASPSASPAPTQTPSPSTSPSAPPSPSHGAQTIGAVLCEGVQVSASDDIQSAINAAPAGTTFCIQGEHRITTAILPEPGDVLQGIVGSAINGSVVVTGWAVSGGDWWAPWARPKPPLSGSCATGTACEYADDAFLDGVKLTRVLNLSEVAPGDVYIDYGNHKVYMGDDPTGRMVEIAVAPAAIDGNNNQVDDVTVTGLIVEKCANLAQYAALGRNQGTGWLIQNNEVRLNHGTGVEVGTGSTVRWNHIHAEGQQGMMGWLASNALVDGNEIDHNNTDGFDQSWEAGGAKWSKTSGLTVVNNYVHDNHGTGLWFDGNDMNTMIINNVITNNDHHGIKYEVSYDATISGNVVTGNGLLSPYGGSGINVEASPNVEVMGNTVSGNQDGILLIAQSRGSGDYGPYLLQDAYVHDNTVTMGSGYTGLINYTTDPTYFTSKNNRFVADHYTLNCSSPERFKWSGATMDQNSWQTYGQDVTGSFGCIIA